MAHDTTDSNVAQNPYNSPLILATKAAESRVVRYLFPTFYTVHHKASLYLSINRFLILYHCF